MAITVKAACPPALCRPVTLQTILQCTDIQPAVREVGRRLPHLPEQTVELATTFCLGDVEAAVQLLSSSSPMAAFGDGGGGGKGGSTAHGTTVVEELAGAEGTMAEAANGACPSGAEVVVAVPAAAAAGSNSCQAAGSAGSGSYLDSSGELAQCMSSALTIATELRAFTERLINLQQQQQQLGALNGSGGSCNGDPHPAVAACLSDLQAAGAGAALGPGLAAALLQASKQQVKSALAPPTGGCAAVPAGNHPNHAQSAADVQGSASQSPFTPPRAPQQQQPQQQPQFSGVVPATPEPIPAGGAMPLLPPRPPDVASGKGGPAAAGQGHPAPDAPPIIVNVGGPSAGAGSNGGSGSGASGGASSVSGEFAISDRETGFFEIPRKIADELFALRDHKAWSDKRIAELLKKLCDRDKPLEKENKVCVCGGGPRACVRACVHGCLCLCVHVHVFVRKLLEGLPLAA